MVQIWSFGTVPTCDVMMKTVGMGWQWAAGGMDLDFVTVPPCDVMLKAVGMGWAIGSCDDRGR